MAHRTTQFLRHLALLLFYILALGGSLWFSYQLRFDFAVPMEHMADFKQILIGTLAVKLLLLLITGQFGSLLTYFGLYDLGKIFTAMIVASFLSYVAWLLGGLAYAPPRAVILTDFVLSFLALSGMRIGFRLLREGYFKSQVHGTVYKPVGIIGAGDVGASLARDLLVRRGLGMTPKVFFDDARAKWSTTIHGIPVYGAPESMTEYLRHHTLDEVVLAMPGAPGRRVREIINLLNQLRIRFEIVPSYEQLLQGKVRVSQIRPVEIHDLLGRQPVDLKTEQIRELIRGKAVLVTGAGGSIGSELCRQIASHAPRQLLLVERCEFLLFQIEQELLALGYGAEIIPVVADILDEPRMTGIMKRFEPQLIFHAAAHKHVPMMEAQPAEAIRNNTLGTRLVATLALKYGAERFVFISTDKAINPTNVMGATKRMAELYIQALDHESSGPTKFMAVRFGNVLGSSGSVIPTFKRQIAAGGPVTVTHPDVTRYFMTVNEAVGLVLQSAALGDGGEIFVLDMGEPMKIVDLARQLIELSGLDPDTDMEIKFTGLRPGEKLYEELNHTTENVVTTEHQKIMRFMSTPQPLKQLSANLDQLHSKSSELDANELKLAIKTHVPEYQPHFSVM